MIKLMNLKINTDITAPANIIYYRLLCKKIKPKMHL